LGRARLDYEPGASVDCFVAWKMNLVGRGERDRPLQQEFPTQLEFFVKYQDVFTSHGTVPGPRVLDTVFTPDNIPRTVHSDAQSDTQFNPFVALLTNGRPDQIEFTYVPPSSRFGASFAFVPKDTTLFPIDWQLFRVTSLSFTQNSFFFDRTRPFNLPGVGVLFPVEVAGVFEVHGVRSVSATPEPPAGILVALGATLLVWWKSRMMRLSIS
jgi:hypothetical protein